MRSDTPISSGLIAGAMLMAVCGNYGVFVIMAIALAEVAWNAFKQPRDIGGKG